MANYDIIGNIAILKFHEGTSLDEKLKRAQEILSQYKSVRTVLEKTDKVSGRLRTIKTNYLLGEKTLISEYNENGCRFKLNVETCYFSPRLAHERQEISELLNKLSKIKKLKVLVMFAGVDPFSIVLAKHSNVKKIISIELGKECLKYAKENIIKNKVSEIIQHIQGDVKRVIPKIAKDKEKFDVILMPRPNLKDTFLKEASLVVKKNTKIIYYGFCAEKDLEKMLDEIHKQTEKCKRKIKVINIKEAGDIAPYEHRYRIEMNVLN